MELAGHGVEVVFDDGEAIGWRPPRTSINPLIAEGQIHGGIAQVLLEDMVYDAHGNPLATKREAERL